MEEYMYRKELRGHAVHGHLKENTGSLPLNFYFFFVIYFY